MRPDRISEEATRALACVHVRLCVRAACECARAAQLADVSARRTCADEPERGERPQRMDRVRKHLHALHHFRLQSD
jgi:hypothetical protein